MDPDPLSQSFGILEEVMGPDPFPRTLCQGILEKELELGPLPRFSFHEMEGERTLEEDVGLASFLGFIGKGLLEEVMGAGWEEEMKEERRKRKRNEW